MRNLGIEIMEKLNLRYIQKQRITNCTNKPFVIEPDNTLCSEPDEVCPRVTIWDPIVQYKLTLKCPEHNCSLRLSHRWTDSAKKLPRAVYDLNGCVFLCVRIYKCESSHGHHFIISTDQDLLNQAGKKQIEVPFVLAHRSGLTRNLLNYVVHR
jgi:hypothetical protein